MASRGDNCTRLTRSTSPPAGALGALDALPQELLARVLYARVDALLRVEPHLHGPTVEGAYTAWALAAAAAEPGQLSPTAAEMLFDCPNDGQPYDGFLDEWTRWWREFKAAFADLMNCLLVCKSMRSLLLEFDRPRWLALCAQSVFCEDFQLWHRTGGDFGRTGPVSDEEDWYDDEAFGGSGVGLYQFPPVFAEARDHSSLGQDGYEPHHQLYGVGANLHSRRRMHSWTPMPVPMPVPVPPGFEQHSPRIPRWMEPRREVLAEFMGARRFTYPELFAAFRHRLPDKQARKTFRQRLRRICRPDTDGRKRRSEWRDFLKSREKLRVRRSYTYPTRREDILVFFHRHGPCTLKAFNAAFKHTIRTLPHDHDHPYGIRKQDYMQLVTRVATLEAPDTLGRARLVVLRPELRREARELSLSPHVGSM